MDTGIENGDLVNGKLPEHLFLGEDEITTDPDIPVGSTSSRTDVSNAEALHRLHGDDIRFVGGWKKWVAWDGRRWVLDTDTLAPHYAVQTTRVMFEDCIRKSVELRHRMLREGPTETIRDLVEENDRDLKHAVKSQSARTVSSMLSMAATMREFIANFDTFDSDPWMLNCGNGTINLKSGALLPHLRTEMITKLTPVNYDADAKCPEWSAFLERVQPSAMMRLYLQRLAGYTLTGLSREEMIAFHFGGGANGKSTFMLVMHEIMGEYGSPAHPKLIFTSSNGDRHLTERATLHGKRFVTCSETSEARSFDEGTLKDLTSNDLIAARRMREDEWKFRPTHKLHLAGNERPIVRATDDGFWRRMHLIPWRVTIPEAERNQRLMDLLRDELPGILAWAVQGCLGYQEHGLARPQEVIDATLEYRGASDAGGLFLASCDLDPCLPGHSEWTMPKKDFREAYERWCKDQGYEPLGARRMAEALRRRGIIETSARVPTTYGSGNVVTAWRGLRFR